MTTTRTRAKKLTLEVTDQEAELLFVALKHWAYEFRNYTKKKNVRTDEYFWLV